MRLLQYSHFPLRMYFELNWIEFWFHEVSSFYTISSRGPRTVCSVSFRDRLWCCCRYSCRVQVIAELFILPHLRFFIRDGNTVWVVPGPHKIHNHLLCLTWWLEKLHNNTSMLHKHSLIISDCFSFSENWNRNCERKNVSL